MINAFSSEYMQTYHPNFWGTTIQNEGRSKKMSTIVTKTRIKNPSHGTFIGISNKVISTTAPAHMHRPKTRDDMIKKKDFHIYAKAHTKI